MNNTIIVIIGELEKKVEDFLNSYIEYLKYDDYEQFVTLINIYDEFTDKEKIGKVLNEYSIDEHNFHIFSRLFTIAIYNYDIEGLLVSKYKSLIEHANMDPDYSVNFKFYSAVYACSQLSLIDLNSEDIQDAVVDFFKKLHYSAPGGMLSIQMSVVKILTNIVKVNMN